jgi:hypothetical protein
MGRSPKWIQLDRRGFFRRLFGLAALPVATQVIAVLPTDSRRARVPKDYPSLGCVIDPIPYGAAESGAP